MYFACTFLAAHLCPKTYYIKRKNQNTTLINQVKIWYLFSSINTHVYSPVTCYIMLCVPQDTIIPCCWIPIKFTIFSFHQLCSFLTFIMLAWTNVAISYVHQKQSTFNMHNRKDFILYIFCVRGRYETLLMCSGIQSQMQVLNRFQC